VKVKKKLKKQVDSSTVQPRTKTKPKLPKVSSLEENVLIHHKILDSPITQQRDNLIASEELPKSTPVNL